MRPVDMTGTPGQAGWFVVTEPHRCSRHFCEQPAVIYYTSTTGGYGWQKQRRHWRRRFSCADHMNEYNAERPWWIEGDRILRNPYDYELEREGA
jgi:hypothetical protein